MNIERANSENLIVNQLPDGSRVIVDSNNDRVFALNQMAGAAWDACSEPTTLAAVRESMQRALDTKVTSELAEEAIRQLKEKDLITTSGMLLSASRRKFLVRLGAAAVPLVVSLTIADQRAHTAYAASKPTVSPCAPINPKCK